MEKHKQLWRRRVEKNPRAGARERSLGVEHVKPSEPPHPPVQLCVDEKLQGLIITAAIVHLQNN